MYRVERHAKGAVGDVINVGVHSSSLLGSVDILM